MAFDIVVRDRIQQSIITKIGKIKVEAKSTVTWVTRLRAQLNGLGSRTGLTGLNGQLTKIQRNLSRTNKQITLMSSGFTRAGNAGRRLLSGALLLSAADGFVDSLDAFQNIQNRLKGVSEVVDVKGVRNATASQERLNEVTRQLFDVANRARVPVSELAKTYRRLDIALNNVGGSQQESIRITETVSKLLSLSGANAGEAASSLLQLSQAFNKAKLDGDEFRSVAELMPSAIKAISEVLQKSLGDKFTNIYDAAEQGLITVEVLRKAFASLAKQVDSDFTRLPRTLGQAFTQLINEITKAFGSSANAGSFLSQIINFIDWIKNNLPTVVQLMKSFVAVMAVQTIGSFVSQLGSITGWLNLIAQGLSALIGYFTFWSDQIKVSTDGLVTLQDTFVAVYQVIRDAAASGQGLLGSVFSAKGAQAAFEMIKKIADFLIQSLNSVVSLGRAIINTLNELSLDEIGGLFVESITAVIVFVQNTFIDLFKFLLDLASKALNKFNEMFYKTAQGIVNAFAGVGNALPFGFGKDAVNGVIEDLIDKLGELAKPKKPIDFGISDMLEKLRVDITAITPLLQRVFGLEDLEIGKGPGLLQGFFNDSFNEIESEYKGLMARILEVARQNTNQRIKEEERVKKAMIPNVDALRPEREVELIGRAKIFAEASELGIPKAEGKKSKKTKTPLEELDLFVKTLSKKAKAIDSLKNVDLDKMKTSIDAVIASLKIMNTEIDSISFEAAGLSAVRYETTAIDVLINIGDAADMSGRRIGESQSAGWELATTAVENYARITISKFNEVARASARAGNGGRFLNAPGNVPIEIQQQGFASGGYTGNIAVNRVAGVVHGREYVMPADATAKYRPLLDAMRQGTSMDSSTGSGVGITINIENYANATHEVQQISANEVRIIARDAVQTGAVSVIARELSQPNSVISKSINHNLRSQRRR